MLSVSDGSIEECDLTRTEGPRLPDAADIGGAICKILSHSIRVHSRGTVKLR